MQLQSCIAEQVLIQNSSSDVLVDLHIIDVHIYLCCMKVFLFDATLKVYQVDAIQLPFASLSQNLFCDSTNFFS